METEKIKNLIREINAERKRRKQKNPTEKQNNKTLNIEKIPGYLDLTPERLQRKLEINRSTWDRWKAGTSLPTSKTLETLGNLPEKLANEKGDPIAKFTDMAIIKGDPCSFSRIRLLFSLRPWKRAIFYFRNAFTDNDRCIDVAILALKGCDIVYIFDNNNEFKEWHEDFVKSLNDELGAELTARVLSQICVIKLDKELDYSKSGFGVLNYFRDSKDHIGYNWQDKDKQDKDKTGEYSSFDGHSDSLFMKAVNSHLNEIENAFNIIEERKTENREPNIESNRIYVKMCIFEKDKGSENFKPSLKEYDVYE